MGRVRRLTKQELRSVHPAIAKLVSALQDELEPGTKPAQIEKGVGTLVAFAASSVMVIPIRILFNDPTNARCRLAVIRRGTSKAEFVALPPEADPVSCRRLELVAQADFNHDGVPDFAFSVDGPSNRYNAILSEGRFYISDSTRETYCYAPTISIFADGPIVAHGSARAVLRAVDDAVRRLGQHALDCWRTGDDKGGPY